MKKKNYVLGLIYLEKLNLKFPAIFGLKNVMERGMRNISTFVNVQLHLKFSGK